MKRADEDEFRSYVVANTVLNHPAGAEWVSLRARSTDANGNTVDQTIVHAYRIR